MGSPRVAAIVLSYNGRQVTMQALASLRQMTYRPVDLVVVDNGSTDGTSDAISAAFPAVQVLRTPVNLGAAGGVNLGIRWAMERGHDYLLILNNDIEVAPDILEHMVELAESNSAIGCVGPKAYYFSDRQRIWSAGGIIRFRESITCERGEGEIDRGQFDRDSEVDYVNGCAMLVRRQALTAAGLWDPLFHLAVEDADFCTRVKAAGYLCFYAHRARLWHMVSYATGVYKAAKTYHTGRSTALYLRRYATPWQRLRSLSAIAVSLPLAFLRELPRRNQSAAVAKARGVVEGLRVPLSPPPHSLEAAAEGTAKGKTAC